MTPTRRSVALGLAVAPLAGRVSALSPAGIHLRETGQGDRVWVLLHPMGASGRFWEARAARLAAEYGVRVISPDLPSHGLSTLVGRFDYDAASTAVGIALGGLPKPELIVGASSGGIVGLLLASVLRVPVAAVGAGDAFTPANLEGMTAAAAALQAAADPFVATFLEQGEPQRLRLAAHYRDLAGRGERPFLDPARAAALAGRALILNGSQDAFFRPDAAHRLAAAIPRSRLTFAEGADHLGPLGADYSVQTWAAVGAFAAASRAG